MKKLAILITSFFVTTVVHAQSSLVDWYEAGSEPREVPVGESPQGSAGVLTVYGTRPDFDLVFPTASQSCEDFEDTNIAPASITGFPAPLDSTTDTALFPLGSIVEGLVLRDNPLNDVGDGGVNGLVAVGAGASGNPSDVVTANTFVDAMELVFTISTTAVAMDVTDFDGGGGVTVSFYDQSDVFLGSVVVASSAAGSFLGVSSPVPIGRVSMDSAGDGSEGGDNICFTSAPPAARATFEVNKDFADGNPNGVEVTISCNTGLPLEQSQVITEGDGVKFVVVEYDDGELDCEITEDVPDGYDAVYFDGTTNSSTSCEYLDQPHGAANTCRITNTPEPVDVDINKDWVIEGTTDGDGLDLRYELTLWCDAEIVNGTQIGGSGAESPSGDGPGCGLIQVLQEGQQGFVFLADWCKTFGGEGPLDATHTAQVIPEYPGSNCYVVENVYDNAVEVSNGCGSLTVSAGEGDSCTVTNTVFFEGIPTLSQYGLALLALLMLGIGAVGFRRYA